ncbi:MAG: hypothetical protein ABR568_16415 [Pyrinomonadaceae bacterium]
MGGKRKSSREVTFYETHHHVERMALVFMGLGCARTPQPTATATPQPTPSNDSESINSVEGSFHRHRLFRQRQTAGGGDVDAGLRAQGEERRGQKQNRTF